MTLEETLQEGAVVITEVNEGGHVPELKLVNRSESNILILDGEELKGAKQNRIVNTTILVAGHSTIMIPVSCVEQGRWSYDSPRFTCRERILPNSIRTQKAQQVQFSAENLLEYLGFMHVQNANEISNYRNPPFDFFGVLDGKPYMIEFKGSLNEFNSPGETQKRRLQELKLKVPTLHVALLQVAIIGGKKNKGEYRLLLDDEMDHLFPGYQIPLDKLENWITERIKEYCPGVKPA